MGKVSKNDIPEVAEFMSDFWREVKNYYIPEHDDDWWDEVIEKMNEIATKANNRLCTKLAIAFLRYLEEVEKSEDKRLAG